MGHPSLPCRALLSKQYRMELCRQGGRGTVALQELGHGALLGKLSKLLALEGTGEKPDSSYHKAQRDFGIGGTSNSKSRCKTNGCKQRES